MFFCYTCYRFFHLACDDGISNSKSSTVNLRYYEGVNIHDLPEPVCINENALASGNLIQGAKVVSGAPDETYALKLILSNLGAKAFADISRKNTFKSVVIVVDGKILTTATIIEPWSENNHDLVLRGVGSGTFGIAKIFQIK